MKICHIPVLLNEVLEVLNPKTGENFIDATINGGGHARAILERISLPIDKVNSGSSISMSPSDRTSGSTVRTPPTNQNLGEIGTNGKLLGIEWDQKIFENLKLESSNWQLVNNLILVNDSYANLKNIVVENNFQQFDGILFDLGMSNWHVEASGKGFSFLRDEPLDMRYDTLTNELTAKEVVNGYSQASLEKVILEYGDESFARVISEQVIKSRRKKLITTTKQLIETISDAVPFWYRSAGRRRRTHFATKTFQALRIEVNHELENIERGIKSAIDIAPTGCRIAVITFHSLEDRIVKNLFKDSVKAGIITLINKKPIATNYKEIRENPKSRSAKLRAVTKNQY